MSPAKRPFGLHDIDELAALLDGEMTDHARAEELKNKLDADPALRAEYEQQRQTKLMLSELGEFDAPEFMHTRVMAAVHARRREPRLLRVPAWSAALGALALFITGFGVATQFAPQPAGTDGAVMQAQTVYPPGLFRTSTDMFDEVYVASEATPELPEDVPVDLRSFLEVSHAAHANARTERMVNGVVTPDLSTAVLVVDSGR